MSAGQIGCLPEDIIISRQQNVVFAGEGISWIAACAGQQYVCSVIGKDTKCSPLKKPLVEGQSKDAQVAMAPTAQGVTTTTAVAPPAPQPATATDPAEQSCKSNPDPKPCFDLGQDFETGKNAAKDLQRAHEYYRLACDKGLKAGCMRADIMQRKLTQ